MKASAEVTKLIHNGFKDVLQVSAVLKECFHCRLRRDQAVPGASKACVIYIAGAH